MSRRIVSVAAVLIVALLAGVAVAAAQEAARVEIGFQFRAGAQVMPPGKYRIGPGPSGSVVITSEDTTATRVMLPVITMLGRHDFDMEPELIFDRVGSELYLSEVWLPGRDGYCLLATTGPHEHHIIGGPKGKK